MFAKYKNFDYYYHLPAGYVSGEKVGIIFSMHGAGRRMYPFDEEKFVTAFEKKVEDGEIVTDCILITPACHGNTWFDIFEQTQEFIRAMIAAFNGDPDRIYLTGVSMGGYCSWQLLMTMPQVFKNRALILCGGGMYWNAARIKAEVHAYHGTVDPCVYFEESRKMVDAVNANGGKATLYPLEGVGHNAWDYAYADQKEIDWLTGKA